MAGALRNIGKNRVYRPQEETEPIKRGALATIGSDRIQEKNRGGLIGGLGYVGGNLGLGLAGIGEGVGDIVSAGADLLRGDTDMAKYRFLDNQTAEAQRSLRDWYNPGTVMEFAGDVASGIGQSSVFLLDAVAPGVGTTLFFAGVGGQGISSAAAQTGDVGWREVGYGVASGVTEGLLEKAMGAGSKVAGKLGASITRKTGAAIGQKGITTALTKSAGRRAWSSIAKATAKDAAGEFAEEFASEYIDSALLQAFGIDPNASTSFGEAVRAGMVGLFSGGIMGAPANVINYKNAAKAGRTIRESGETENLLNRAQATVSVLREQEAVKKAEGKKVKKTDEGTEAAEQKGFLARQGAKREARRAAEYAAKLEKNVNAYRNMKAEMRNSEVGDALLGELRGNLYFTNMAYAVEEAEIVLRNVDDAQAQKIVDYINTEAKKAKQEKSDYTVEDFRLNRDGILSRFAAKGRMEQLVNGEWTEAEEMAAQAAEATESPVEAAETAGAVTGEEVDTPEQAAPAEESEAVQAAETPADHKARAEQILREMGETVSLDKLATAIAKKQAGEALDANERLLLKDNRKAELVMERMQRESQQKKAPEKEEAKLEAQKQVNGTVTVSDGMKPNKDFSDVQYATYKAAGILADSLGLNIEIHKSLERNGKIVNGYYDTGTKVLHVNINAMRDGKQIALYTLGHELTHYIKDWSPEKFNALADFVAEQMGTDMETAVDEKMASLRRLGLLDKKTTEQAAEMAREEVVADGMELILTDGRVLDELAKTDKSLWERVRDWIKNTVAKIRKYYGELNQASKTAQVLKETMDSLDELERLFTEGAREAGERTRTAGVETETAEAGGKVFSFTLDDYEKPITIHDVEVLRSIGRKSVNAFTSADIEKAQKWAYKFYQEMGTKSPFFRAWFGDWRAYDTKTKLPIVPVNAETIDRGDVPRGDFKNEDTGWSITSNSDGIDETSNKEKKSSESYHALRDVDNLLKNAVLLDTVVVTDPSKRMGKNAALMHHMYCPISVNGKIGVAKLYIAESLGDKHKFYLMRIEKASTARGFITENGESTPRSTTTADDAMVSIAQIFEFVKEHHKDFEKNSDHYVPFEPKPVNELMLDENKEPKVFYHGTDAEWTEYDLSKNVNQKYGEGIYLTPDPNRARLYGDRVIPLYVKATTDFREAKKTGRPRDYTFVKATGDIVVVSPEQIKSATDNIGTFDGTNPDIRYSIDEDSDTAYLAVVERGDMDTAQKMVDEAAKRAGYINLFYHGAKKGGGFTVFRDWSYFTENKAYAERYTDREKPSSLYKTYVKMDKTFDTRKTKDRRLFAQIRDEYGLGEIQDTGLPDWTDGYDISDYIDENDLDYDGIILDEGGDLVDGVPISRGLSYVVRKSAQIKSADPVTYDDSGNVIPLSERFKEDNPDIRYSIDENTENADVSENEKLEAENKRLNEKIQRMAFERFRRAVKDGEIAAKDQKPALSKGADAVLESIGVTDGRNKEGLLQRMSETYARMAAEKGISYEKAFSESGEIADWLISKQPLVRDAATAEQAGEIIKTLHGTKIRLTFTQKAEVTAIMGSSDAYRKAMFGKVTVNDKDGVPLDVQWAEWAEQYPEVFSKDTPEADMPERLREIYGTLVEMRDNVETIDEYISKEALTVTIFTQIGEIGYKAEESPINDRALLAEALSGAAVSEHEYKIIKDYKAASDELAANDRRLAELRRETAELNQEIKFLQDKLRGVDKIKREPWVMTALTDAIKRKGELMDEMDALAAKIKKADERFFSLRAAAPVRRAMNELNKKIKAEEKRAERAEAKAEQAKEKYEAEAEYKSDRREMSVRERVARRVIGRLNTMFYSPSRTKHVPADLQALVEQVLRSEKLDTFKETRKNLRQMAELERDIEKLEQNPARTASEQERLDKLHYKYAMLEDEGLDAKGQAEALYTAFKTWMESRPEGQQDKALLDKLSSEIDKMQEMPLSRMSKKSLEAVEDFYKMIYHQVKTANQIYTTERVLYVDDLGGKASQEAQDTKSLKFLSPKAMEIKGKDSIRRFFWKNMKPLTVFEAIGSKTFTGLFQAVLDGEGVWAKDILEARAKIVEAREAHKYKDWDLEKRVEVKTKEGTVKLSLSERMSLYAYAKRAQAVSHLEGGGFVLDPKATTKEGKTIAGIALEKRLNDSTRYVLDETLMGDIASTLTAEQKAYVDEMQTYLTQLGKKGNEVSRKLYGMEIFKEDFYFPIKVKSEYLASQTGKTGDPNIKNRGMTKEVVPEAKDPLVLQGFDEVMADHINSMATYHAFVLPVEDLTRVLNYKPANYLKDENGEVILDDAGKPKADPDAAKDYSTLKAVIEDKYGADAVKYIEQVIRDLNGGARRDAAAGILDRGLTAFKRASTMASLSVLVQQPTSLIRAAAYIEPKYLFGNATIIDFKNHAELWERVKKYAPVAVIKEMGGYDTGVGTRTADYLNATEYEKGERLKGFLKDENYRAEVFGRGAAYADEMAWIQMFEACVSEQADKMGKSRDSEEVLQAAGKRFEEVIRHTQVYDSTLTRSENMRSKDTGMKMATAFMAEPTTIVSMVAEAIMKAERGDKTFLRNTAAAVAGSIVINAIAASLVYAMRDDDEDETYGEKYVSTLAMEVADGFNPLGYLPVARDVVSLMQGYEVERTDMALIGNLIDQVNMITSSKRSVGDKIFGVSGAVSAFFGVPVTNLYRDAKGAINTVLNSTSPEATTGAGVSAAVKKEFTTIFGLFDKQTTDGYQLYKAYVDGDTAHYNRVKARYEDEKAAEQALRRELRENDRRIGEAAKARMNGETELYESIVRAIVSEGIFDRNMVIRAVNNEISALERELEKGTLVPEDPDAEETAESLYKASDLNAALERGDRADFELIYDTILGERMEQGKTEAQAKAAVKSSITAYWKKQYLSGYQDTETRKRIIKLLTDTGLYGSRNDVATMCEGWVRAKK